MSVTVVCVFCQFRSQARNLDEAMCMAWTIAETVCLSTTVLKSIADTTCGEHVEQMCSVRERMIFDLKTVSVPSDAAPADPIADRALRKAFPKREKRSAPR